MTNAGVASGNHQEVQTLALSDGTLIDPRSVRALTSADIVTVVTQKSATSTGSTVTTGATVSTLLASNVNRLGATFFNESGAAMDLHLGGAGSFTLYTVQVPISGYYEVPFGYTGIITGISLVAAVIRIVEFT